MMKNKVNVRWPVHANVVYGWSFFYKRCLMDGVNEKTNSKVCILKTI